MMHAHQINQCKQGHNKYIYCILIILKSVLIFARNIYILRAFVNIQFNMDVLT